MEEREDYRRTIYCVLHSIRGDHHAVISFGVPGRPLEDADARRMTAGGTHACSMSPSSSTHTVISVTVWVLVAPSR